MTTNPRLVRPLGELDVRDVARVGQNGSLGEICRKLAQRGGYVPNGFAVTATTDAHRYLLDCEGA